MENFLIKRAFTATGPYTYFQWVDGNDGARWNLRVGIDLKKRRRITCELEMLTKNIKERRGAYLLLAVPDRLW